MFTESCRFEVPRQDGVCQIRLDFVDFSIDQGPDAQTFGDCSTDTLTISGASNSVVGPLCGDLRGQHSKTTLLYSVTCVYNLQCNIIFGLQCI